MNFHYIQYTFEDGTKAALPNLIFMDQDEAIDYVNSLLKSLEESLEESDARKEINKYDVITVKVNIEELLFALVKDNILHNSSPNHKMSLTY